MHLNSFAAFFILDLPSSFWLLPPLWNFLHPSAHFRMNLLLLQLPPIHYLRPFLQSFCCSIDTEPILPQKHKEKEQSSRLLQDLSHSGVFVTSFLFAVRKLAILSFSTNSFFCTSLFSSYPFSFSFSSTSFPSASSELATIQLVL